MSHPSYLFIYEPNLVKSWHKRYQSFIMQFSKRSSKTLFCHGQRKVEDNIKIDL